jgi:hypothetical protein
VKGLFKNIILFALIGFNSVFAQPSLMTFVKDNTNSFNELSYYDSTQFSVDFPDGKQLVFNLQVPGHGDIFEPFRGIRSTVKNFPADIDELEEFNTKNAVKKIIKVVAKKKIQSLIGEDLDSFIKDLPPFVRWVIEKVLKNGGLSPTEEFIFRSYLLYKSDLGANSDALKRAEFVALLFKLAITNGQTVLDVQADLTEYLSKNEALNEVFGSKFITLTTDTIKFVQGDENLVVEKAESKVLVPQVKLGYLFKNKEQAEQCYSLFAKNQKYSEKDFNNIVKNYVQGLVVQSQDVWSLGTGFEIISYDKFLEYKDSTFGNFVGLKFEFGTDFLPEGFNKDSDVLFYSDNDGYWVLFKGKQGSFNVSNEIKLVLRAFYKAFDSYRRLSCADPLCVKNNVNLLPAEKEKIKDKLKDLLKSKKYREAQIKSLDKEIKVFEAKGNSTWNKFFSRNIEEELKTLKDEMFRKQELLLDIDLQIKKLRFATYSFSDLDNLKELNGKGTIAIVADMFLSNPRVAQVMENINTNSRYALIKENLVKDLFQIFGKSELIKENIEIIEYLLSGLFPEYKEYFQDFTKNLNQQDDTADLLLSFVGL